MELLKECCGTGDPLGKLKGRQDTLPLIKMHLPCVQICFFSHFFCMLDIMLGPPPWYLKYLPLRIMLAVRYTFMDLMFFALSRWGVCQRAGHNHLERAKSFGGRVG